MPADIISIDLGGTKCAGALVSESGNISGKKETKITGFRGDEAGDIVVHLCQELFGQNQSARNKIRGIAVSVPGISYHEKGIVWAPNIPDWTDYPLKDKLLNAFGKSVTVNIESDRSCAIAGECWLGAAQGLKDAIFLAFGTGIGAGILVDGHILRGKSDIAGAIGWLVLDDIFHDGYEKFGCFEYNASGDGLVRVAKDFYNTNMDFLDTDLNISELSSEMIFDEYEKGDKLSTEVIRRAIRYWGRSAANLVSIFNPEMIIFGGGLFGPAAKFIDDIYMEAKKYAQPVAMKEVIFRKAQLGNDAPLLGAAWLLMKIQSAKA